MDPLRGNGSQLTHTAHVSIEKKKATIVAEVKDLLSREDSGIVGSRLYAHFFIENSFIGNSSKLLGKNRELCDFCPQK